MVSAQSAPAAPGQAPATNATAIAVQVNPGSMVIARGLFNQVVTLDDLNAELLRMTEASRQKVLSNPETIQQVATNLLVRRVLAFEAQRDGLAKLPLVAAALNIASDRALSDARLAKLDEQNSPSDAALEAYARNAYQASGARFEKPAQTRARHILIDNKGPESLAKANELLAQLRAGASFEDLAKANSTDAGSAARGGDLGFFGAGQMVRPFEDAVNTLNKPGDLSAPVESQFGYHIIRLEERREQSRQPYEAVRTVLMNEARIPLTNEARIAKITSINKEVSFDKDAIEALSKLATQ